MVKHPLFGEVSKDFNESAAMKMYDLYNEDPAYAAALIHMAAHQEVSRIALESPEVIEDLVFSKYAARKDLVKDAILSGVVNKSMSNETVDAVVAAMDTISKAVGDQYTSWERAENVKQQRRDVHGRFVKMGKTKIESPRGVESAIRGGKGQAFADRGFWNSQTEAYDRVARDRGYRKPETVREHAALNTAHSAAYLQVADALKNLDPTDMVMADITYRAPKRDKDGALDEAGGTEIIRRTKVGQEPEDFINAGEFGSGELPTSITWYMDSDSEGAGRFNVLTGAGMGAQTALDVENMARDAGPAARQFNRSMGEEYTGEYGGRKYGNLSALSNMVESVAGDKLSPEGKAALGAAKAVGEYGAEAEKVLGPAARRAAYRYRGTEQKPDAKLDRSIAMSVAGSKSINDAHEKLIHPTEVTEQVGMDFESRDEHSPFIRYWQNKLPKREYVQLHLDSGTTPPSQGVVFDAKGQVISQSVGYGDDHYLPFNLKKLTGANRGEWVRTRTMGGPTTEDVYAALITGTRSITVVSHSGVYNVEFDESFRGGRRFNDKTKRMVRRYAQLLDTLDAESTTLQKIPQDREDEIRTLVNEEIPGEGKEANAARIKRIKELKEVEKQNPTPSKAQKALWTAEFGQRYAEKAANAGGDDEMTWDGVKANLRIRAQMEADEEFDRANEGRAPWMIRGEAERVEPLSDDDAIERLGAKESYDRFMKQKEAEYRTAQRPLKLNGQGYYFALQALQEQFPHAIKRVEWYPTDDQASKDSGYVPHNFNRPKAAKEGFWSTEIEGVNSAAITNIKGKNTGKVAAHHTNYQNYAARQRAGVTPEDVEEAATPQAPESTPNTQDRQRPDRPDRNTAEADATNGVMLTGLTPSATNNTTVQANRRRLARRAADQLGAIQITYRLPNDTQDRTTILSNSHLPGLDILTNQNGYTLSDPDVQDRLADEVEGIVRSTGNVGVQGGVTSLRSMIANNPQGARYLQDYERRITRSRVENPKTVDDLIRRVDVMWDFSAPGVDGEDFLPGGNRRSSDFRRILGSDRDTSRIRSEFANSNEDWQDYRVARIQDIDRANSAVADVAAGSYADRKITYNNRDWNVPGGVRELSEAIASEAIGLAKVQQLMAVGGWDPAANPFDRQQQPQIGFVPANTPAPANAPANVTPFPRRTGNP